MPSPSPPWTTRTWAWSKKADPRAARGPRDTLEWSDPPLYAAMASVPHEDADPARPALANGSLLGAPDGVLVALQWQDAAATRRSGSYVALEGSTLVAHAADDEEARRTIGDFLRNVSEADEEERDRTMERAIAGRTKIGARLSDAGDGTYVPIWSYTTPADLPWRIPSFLAQIGASNATKEAMTPGTARHELAPWAFMVAFPTRSATLDGILLAVDASGAAQAVAGDRERSGVASAEESIARVHEAMVAHGLPPPEDPRVLTTVC